MPKERRYRRHRENSYSDSSSSREGSPRRREKRRREKHHRSRSRSRERCVVSTCLATGPTLCGHVPWLQQSFSPLYARDGWVPGNKACAASFLCSIWNPLQHIVYPLFTLVLQGHTTLHSTSQTLTNGSLLHITLTWGFIWNTLESTVKYTVNGQEIVYPYILSCQCNGGRVGKKQCQTIPIILPPLYRQERM